MSGRRFFRPRLVSSRHDGGGSRDQDRTAEFRSVMLPHMDAAYNFARFLVRDAAAAEDLVQEAFLRAYRGFAGWRGDNSKAWLFAIVRNCHRDAAISRNDPLRHAEPVDAIDDCVIAKAEGEKLEERIAHNSDIALLRRTIDELPEPFREALVLRELEELSYREIACITQVPIGTVMSRLARARQILATMLLPVSRRAQL